MDDNAMLIVFAVTIFVVSMIAARLPFLFKKGKKIKLHMLITFSTGIMLGVLHAADLEAAKGEYLYVFTAVKGCIGRIADTCGHAGENNNLVRQL